jgi:hypothetical protein
MTTSMLDRAERIDEDAPVAVVGGREGALLNRRAMRGGAALIGAGGVLCAAGVLMCTTALVNAVRRRLDRMEEPPSRVARRWMTQARAATQAGMERWQQTRPASAARR